MVAGMVWHGDVQGFSLVKAVSILLSREGGRSRTRWCMLDVRGGEDGMRVTW